jgi:hypothetical protein
MRRLLLCFNLLLVCLYGQSPAKSGFNGAWKMDPARSDFGSGPVSESRLDRISYNEPNLKDTITQKLHGPETTYDMIYTTDGKECSNRVRGNQVKSTAHWAGDELVIDSKVFALREETMNDRWTLSADGKTLTLSRHMSGAINADQKIVFARQ